MARLRAWWDGSTFLGDVALVFTVVTVGNSVMMLTGLDEPKTGTFAYVHLLGRLGIITVLVGLFYLDGARERLAHWWRQAGRLRSSPRTLLRSLLDSFLGGALEGASRVFTALVAVTCVLTVALAGIRTPDGGEQLYRALVLLALVLLPVMSVASRWAQGRPGAGRPGNPTRRH